MWVMAVKISQPNRPCTFVSMFCPHSCDLAQLTAEQMDIVMDWPKRTHVCMCTQEHTHAHSYSLLHHSPYERLFCRHPVSFALRCAAVWPSCSSSVWLCPLWVIGVQRSMSSFYNFYTRALKNSSLGRIRLELTRTVSWVKESSCFTKMHIPTQTEARAHKNTHMHTRTRACFILSYTLHHLLICFFESPLNAMTWSLMWSDKVCTDLAAQLTVVLFCVHS